MFTRRLPLAAALLILLPLGGCSYHYDLRAVIIDGRLAFTTDTHWLSGQPTCLREIEVFAYTPDYDVRWRAPGTYETCVQDFPVFYGQPVKGVRPDAPDTVKAKALKRGVIYHVNSTSSGGGSGTGLFRLTSDGQVENLERSDVYPPTE